MKKRGYFVEAVMGFEETNLVNNADDITCRQFFNQIHTEDRPSGHSGNKIIINNVDEIFAIKCNCGEIHPVIKNGKYFAQWGVTLQKKLVVKYKQMSHNNVLNCIDL